MHKNRFARQELADRRRSNPHYRTQEESDAWLERMAEGHRLECRDADREWLEMLVDMGGEG
jgi:hypothetical protein